MKTLLLILAILLLAAPAVAGEASVTYVTSKAFYVDAGSDSGLLPGTEVEILRDGVVVGVARVTEATARRAICTWTTPEFVPAVGDVVRFTAAAIASADGGGSGGGSWFDRVGLHGRVGLQTLHIRDRSDYGSDFDRPSLMVRLRGNRLGGRALGTEIDVRAAALRQTREGDSTTESRSRVYRLNLFGGDPARGWNWNVGRQYAPSLSVIHLFDGARAEYVRGRWSVGALGGMQPDPELGLSADVVEAGAWISLRETRGTTRWAFTTAMVGSRSEGEVDREFAWLQGRWSRGDLTLRADQVLDFNRGWKKDAGEPTIASTSTYLMASWQAHRRLNLNGGFDNRRRVRFLRDQETPETEFDDSYRQGIWIGARGAALDWLDVGISGRTRLIKDRDAASSATLTLGFRTGWWGNLRASSRSTVYRSELVEGWLQSGRLSVEPHPRWSFGAFGGARHETGRLNDLMDGTDPWGGLDADFTITRNAWLSLRWESQFTGEEAADQVWVGTGLRF